MEEVYLTSDILIHYFLAPAELDASEWGEEADAARKAYEVVKERHDRAIAIVKRIFEEQLTAYISDMVLIETVKAFEELSYEEPEEEPRDPENPLAPDTSRLGWATKKPPSQSRFVGGLCTPILSVLKSRSGIEYLYCMFMMMLILLLKQPIMLQP